MKHIYFVNAHPDDLIAVIGIALKLKDAGNYILHVVDATHGERGLPGIMTPEQCAAVRDEEERKVCSYLGVEPVWLSEHDGSAFASEQSTRQLAEMYAQNPPDAVFTQWPIDCHLDHTICAAIALNAIRMASGLTEGILSGKWPEVFFYHYAGNGMLDNPNCFVPLTEEEMRKKVEIVSLYKCQNGPGMAQFEKETNAFHGARVHKEYAEAFTRMQPLLPGETSLLDELPR